MIPFAHLRTKRVSVTLSELTLDQGIALCRMPGASHEHVATQFLRYVAAGADKPRDTYVTDPLLWTVEERLRVVTHYMAHVSDDGPDFSIGDRRFTDYAELTVDEFVDFTPIGEVGGRKMVLRPLLGVHAQLLERVCEDAGEWLIGAMACCLEDEADLSSPADLASLDEVGGLKWVQKRIEALRARPESETDQLYLAFASRPSMRQFFRIDFGDEGIVCMPVEEGEVGAPPARFRAHTCVSQTTRSLFARPAVDGG